MTSITKHWSIGALLVAISLGWYASSVSDNLDAIKKENRALVDAVKDRDGTITVLKDAASAERRATEEQLRIEQDKRSKADAENRTLRQALEHSDCGNQHLPADVIDILRRKA